MTQRLILVLDGTFTINTKESQHSYLSLIEKPILEFIETYLNNANNKLCIPLIEIIIAKDGIAIPLMVSNTSLFSSNWSDIKGCFR